VHLRISSESQKGRIRTLPFGVAKTMSLEEIISIMVTS